MNIKSTIKFISDKLGGIKPQIAIILGTGLGQFSDKLKVTERIQYDAIPGFMPSTVQSHKGELIIGIANDIPVIALSGRFHFYEGYSMKQITYPVRVLGELGITQLLLSNAAGAVNPLYSAGDLVVIRDHY